MLKVIIVILIILLFIAAFYLYHLKKSLKALNKDLENKLKAKSNVLLTASIADKDLARLINMINHTLKEYNEIQDNYENKSQSLQKMMINISHDLRTPLTSILGYIDILLNSNLDIKTQMKYLNIIQNRLKDLSALVDSFFELSKVITNSQSIDYYKINVVGLLEECIASFYEDFNNQNRTIDFQSSKNSIYLNSNSTMLKRIFNNLIVNAYKHSTSNLNIHIKETKNQIIIKFNNKIDLKDIDVLKIFDEFYTADISRTKGHTGLGLYIAKEFTKQLNGDIKASKNKEDFTITIIFKKSKLYKSVNH